MSTVHVVEQHLPAGRTVQVFDPVTKDRFPVDVNRIVGAAETSPAEKQSIGGANENRPRRFSRRKIIKTNRLVDGGSQLL